MTSEHDDRVIDVEPKNIEQETFDHLYEDSTPGERPPLLRYKYSEPWMKPWAKRAIRVSPLLGTTVNDGLYLRSSIGDGWLAFPLAGLIFSIIALFTNHAAATPPALWLVLTLTVIGIFDVFAGALAWVVYVLGSVLTGHLFVSSWIGSPGHPGILYVITSYFLLAILWFIGPALPRKLRRDPLQDPEKFFDKLYMWGGDVFVSGLAMLVVMGAFPSLAPTLTGAARFGLTTVTLQNHATIFKIVIVAAIVIRALYERFVIQAFELFHPWDGKSRPAVFDMVGQVLVAAMAYLCIWEVIGTQWFTWFVWGAYLFIVHGMASFERNLPPQTDEHSRPRNLFKILFTTLYAQVTVRYLNGSLVSGPKILGWLAIAMAVLTISYAFIEAVHTRYLKEVSIKWLQRLGGIAVTVALFIVSQGFVSISAPQYSGPRGVAISSSGVLYIADSGNNRVIRVTPAGKRTTVGGSFSTPAAVAIDPSTAQEIIYVIDRGHNRIVRIDGGQASALGHMSLKALAAGQGQTTVGRGIAHPSSISVDYRGVLYVADVTQHRIAAVLADGSTLTVRKNIDAASVFVDASNSLWAVNSANSKLLRFSVSYAKSGAPTLSANKLYGGFNGPTSVAVDANGNIYVAEAGLNRIVLIQPDGIRESIPFHFADPAQLSVDGSGHVYVADTHGNDIRIVTPLYSGGRFGTAPSGVGTAMAVTSGGKVYAVSASTGTLEQIDDAGNQVLVKGLIYPSGVAVSAIGRWYISEPLAGKIVRVDITTGSVSPFVANLKGVTALAPDSYGGLFALNPTAGNLYTISAQGVVRLLVGGLHHPNDLSQDAYGYIDVAYGTPGKNDGGVIRIIPGSKPQIIAQHMPAITGLTTDKNGNVFYIDSGTNQVFEYMGALGTQVAVTPQTASGTLVSLGSNRRGDVYTMADRPNSVMRYRLSQLVSNY